MARMPRIKVDGEAAGYHVVTRVSHREYRLDAEMKEYFISLLYKLKKLYYVSYSAFAVMDNHYHLLVSFHEPEDIDAEEALGRWNEYHADTMFVRNTGLAADREYVVAELCDVSSFMKRLNYFLTIRYNWLHKQEGTLWQRRFRSSVVERGYAMASCGAYIELNGFRALLCGKPEEYRYSSLYYLEQGNRDDLIDISRVNEGLGSGTKDFIETYKAYIYAVGESPHKGEPNGIVVTEAMRACLKKYYLQPEEGLYAQRRVSFVQGKVTGGPDFVKDFYEAFLNPGLQGSVRDRHASGWLLELGERLWSLCSAVVRNGP